MSLLTLCQAVADDIGLDVRPATIVNNPDVDAQRMLRMAGRVCSDLATRAPWQALRREVTFTTVAAETQPGIFPADFHRMSPETLWDRTTNIFISGQMGPTEYQSRKNSPLMAGYAGPMKYFTRRGDALLIWPAPAAGLTVAFEYQSNAFCRSAAGTNQTAWAADTDLSNLPEELVTLGVIARFLEADGQPWQSAKAEFEKRLTREIRSDRNSPRILMVSDIFGGSRRFSGEPGPDGNIGYYY
jgi:hypothetical protein